MLGAIGRVICNDYDQILIHADGGVELVNSAQHCVAVSEQTQGQKLLNPIQLRPRTEVDSMPDYKAPLRDIKFVMTELLNSEQHYSNQEGAEDATPDMVDAIIGEGAKFCEQVLSPLN